MIYPVIIFTSTNFVSYHIKLLSSHRGDRVSSEEESGPAETAREAEIGSVPTETAEEVAALHLQEILQRQERREADACRHRESRYQLTPQHPQQAREADAHTHGESRDQLTPHHLQQAREADACTHRQTRSKLTPHQRQEVGQTNAHRHRERRA